MSDSLISDLILDKISASPHRVPILPRPKAIVEFFDDALAAVTLKVNGSLSISDDGLRQKIIKFTKTRRRIPSILEGVIDVLRISRELAVKSIVADDRAWDYIVDYILANSSAKRILSHETNDVEFDAFRKPLVDYLFTERPDDSSRKFVLLPIEGYFNNTIPAPRRGTIESLPEDLIQTYLIPALYRKIKERSGQKDQIMYIGLLHPRLWICLEHWCIQKGDTPVWNDFSYRMHKWILRSNNYFYESAVDEKLMYDVLGLDDTELPASCTLGDAMAAMFDKYGSVATLLAVRHKHDQANKRRWCATLAARGFNAETCYPEFCRRKPFSEAEARKVAVALGVKIKGWVKKDGDFNRVAKYVTPKMFKRVVQKLL